jgi:hypothetical protein
MHFSIITPLGLAALVASSPVNHLNGRQTVATPDTVYGVDPSQLFHLYAATDATSSPKYVLNPIVLNNNQSTVGLQAVLLGGSGSLAVNYTLLGNHYGTQLYAHLTGHTPDVKLDYSNDSPMENAPLSFHIGTDHPNAGGLGFYGKYVSSDADAGQYNYLVGDADTDFTKAFSVCVNAQNTQTRLLVYHGTDSSCEFVTVRAVQT